MRAIMKVFEKMTFGQISNGKSQAERIEVGDFATIDTKFYSSFMIDNPLGDDASLGTITHLFKSDKN